MNTRPVRLILCLSALSAFPASGQVQITPGPEKIVVQIDGKPFRESRVAAADATKPYLHPLRAASGTYVTRMWPMENVAEEEKDQKDHQHQRGVWFAHDNVNGLDFWNNEASYTTPNRGKIVLKQLGAAKSGADSGSIAAAFEWQDLKGTPLLREDCVMTFYRDPALRTIDFDITLTAIQKATFGDSKDGVFGIRLRPVLQEDKGTGHILNADGLATEKATFGDSKDGVFGIRLRPVLQEDKGTGHILNADGLATEKAAWGKPSNWCDYSGDVHGEKLGIAPVR